MNFSDSVKRHKGYSWYSDKYKIIYLGIPKTASTSMRHMFKIDKNLINLNDIPSGKEKYRVFTILREPVARFAAAMREAFIRPETPPHISRIEKIEGTSAQINAFLDEMEKEFCETHTAPQIHFFTDNDGNEFKFDEVLIFERIGEDYKDMCEKFGIDIPLLHKNNKAKKDNKYIQAIKNDPKLRERVEKIYAQDIELYKRYSK